MDLADYVKEASAAKNIWLEKILERLLEGGIHPDQIEVQHHPSGRICVLVNGHQAAEWRLSVKIDNNPLITRL